MLDPDMPLDQLLLMAGEMNENEILVARAFIRAANNHAQIPLTDENIKRIAFLYGNDFDSALTIITECNKILRGE